MYRRAIATVLILLAIITGSPFVPFRTAKALSTTPAYIAAATLSQPTLSIWSARTGSGNITDPGLVPGNYVTVSVNVTSAPAFNRYSFNLEYNPTVLRLVNASLIGTLFWGNLRLSDTYVVTYIPGSVQLSVYGTRSFSGNGTLLFVTFNVLLVSLSVLSLTNSALALDFNGISHSDKGGCFNNLVPRQPTITPSSNPGPGYDQTSEFMIGKVSVGIILPESDGPVYNWTDVQINETISGIKAAMDWWKSQVPNGTLEFTYNIHVRVPTTYEPFLMSFGDTTWIGDVMSKLGYLGDAFAATRAYDNDLRSKNSTDWAFTILVADSGPYDVGFGGSHGYAYALIGGPFAVMARYSTWAWAPAPYSLVVPAHETGHIFGASDEYDNVLQYSGYLWTPDADGSTGIMDTNNLKVSASTMTQIGILDCDSNGIPDIEQGKPAIFLNSPPANISSSGATVTGTAIATPYPTKSPAGRDVTIAKVTSVEYQVDNGTETRATPMTGNFTHTVENFSFSIPSLPPGTHSVSVRALDSFGNAGTTSFQVNVIPSSTGTAGLIRWQAMPTFRLLDLTKNPQQVFQAYVTSRNSSTYVRVKFAIVGDNGQSWTIVSGAVRLAKDEQRILEMSWLPPSIRARYRVNATLYYSMSPLGSGLNGWTPGGSKGFVFQVLT